jgi:hypothetical protein
VFRLAPREVDVEKVRGCIERRCDSERYVLDTQVLVAMVALTSRGRDRSGKDWRERCEKEVESVERADDCVLRLGTRRRDLRDGECLDDKGRGVISKYTYFCVATAFWRAWSQGRI